MRKLTFQHFLLYLFLVGCSFGSTNLRKSNSHSGISYDRKEVVRATQDLIGIPYRYGGKDKRGFDCAGLTQYIFKSVEVSLPPSAEMQSRIGKEIKLEKVVPGDLLYFKRSKLGRVFHVALVVSHDVDGIRVVHSTSTGVNMDNISKSKYWSSKVIGARDVLSN